MLIAKPGFFDWERYPFQIPSELKGESGANFQVAVVGAGPVGLATALGLAQQGIKVVCLEARDQLSDSSRTLAVSRRSVQVLDRLGVADAFTKVAVTRDRNHVYYGSREIHSAQYERSATEKYPDISVVQQPWTEKVLLDAVLAHPNIDLRWLSPVASVNTDNPLRPQLEVQTAQGNYELVVDFVVAADGARGVVRRALGLDYEEIGDGILQRNFVICDFEMKSELPVARRLWIRPPYKPNSAVILHRQPFDTWRLDYALDDDESLEEALKPENVEKMVAAQIKLLGDKTAGNDWKVVWISAYRPMSRSLKDYRQGHVIFAGDAAHQTPIFGGRGMNQGLLDSSNLTWRLAFVIKGIAPESILDGYDKERRPVIVRNLHAIGQATLCMTAPSKGASIMRRATFDLLPYESFALGLVDAFNANKAESLLTPPPEVDPATGAAVGSPLPDASLVEVATGNAVYLHDGLLRHGMTGIYISDLGKMPEELKSGLDALQAGKVPFKYILVAKNPSKDAWAHEVEGSLFDKLNVCDGTWLLVRPDGYVASRMQCPVSAEVKRTLIEVLAAGFVTTTMQGVQ